MSKTSVLIVDDHPLVRKGLRMTIESQDDLAVVGEAGTVHEAIEAAARLQPTIITLDLSMPGPSGVASVERLRAAVPNARIVVVTMHDDPAYVRSAIAMGAAGYVNKSAADTELISAIRAVARGRVFIDVGDAATLESILSPGAPSAGKSPIESLSEREREVLEMRFGLLDGQDHTLEEVGKHFGVTRERIRQIEAKALRKLRHPTRSRQLRDYLEM